MLAPLTALQHPGINPVMLSLGPLEVHWYGVGYMVGILFAWWYAKRMAGSPRAWAPATSPITPLDIDDFLIWAIAGILLGGRLGYVLFYDLQTYLAAPSSIFAIWRGGMSFHGGLAGITIAMILFARRRSFPAFNIFDLIAAACGIGIFLVRMTNFINAELHGDISTLPWAVVFPNDPLGLPRHPSQIYEGLLEGLMMFLILFVLVWRFALLRYPGMVSGVFLIGYASSRILVETVRLPDPQIGYLLGTHWITMGMVLSVPVLLVGIWLLLTARSRKLPDA